MAGFSLDWLALFEHQLIQLLEVRLIEGKMRPAGGCVLALSKIGKSLLVRHRSLVILAFGLLVYVGDFAFQAKQVDGFLMHCIATGNGTGSCTNEEDGREFQCLIVPGQIVTCPVNESQSVECEWISGVHAGQAQFWCDQQDETAMYASIDSELEPEELDDKWTNDNEIDAPSPFSSEADLDNKIFDKAF